MEVKLAKCAGFCFGVKRAVDTVYERLSSDTQIYTYGPIVHNEEIIADLEKAGVKIAKDEGDLKALSGKDCLVIIRAHGIPKGTQLLMEACEIPYIDATCPFVKRIHRIVEEKSSAGHKILIIGDPAHPEVVGIKGWCENDALIIESIEEAAAFSKEYIQKENEILSIVAQTTFRHKKFHNIVEFLLDKGYNIDIADTICGATKERQESAKALAKEVDAMIVIGGKNSSNTRKLAEICAAECEKTFFVQTLRDLKDESFCNLKKIGITAGASTPNKIIEEVQNYVRINF